MQTIFRSHLVAILTCLAVFFLIVMVGYYIWGVGYLLTSEDAAEKQIMANSQAPQFNLNAAAELDYRGIIPTSTSQ